MVCELRSYFVSQNVKLNDDDDVNDDDDGDNVGSDDYTGDDESVHGVAARRRASTPPIVGHAQHSWLA